MTKQLMLLALLSQGLSVSARHLDAVFEEIKQTMDSFQKHFDAIDKYMEESFPSFKELKESDKKEVQKKLVEISADTSNVIVKLHLGELNVQEINIEADGDTLQADVPLKDGSAHFYVQNGRLFGLSFKREVKKEIDDTADNKDAKAYKQKAQYIESSASTKVESLPDQVDGLEKAQVSYKDGVLELVLPKVPEKKGTKLHVLT